MILFKKKTVYRQNLKKQIQSKIKDKQLIITHPLKNQIQSKKKTLQKSNHWIFP